MHLIRGLGLLLLVMGCRSDELAAPVAPPVILSSTVAPVPGNVLSAVVTTRTAGSDSVTVRFRRMDAVDATLTPAVPTIGEVVVVPVLGLFPSTRYTLQVVGYGGGQVVEGPPLFLDTSSLPDDLPAFTASGSDPTPGFIVLAAGPYGLVLDNSGRVVWYRHFPAGLGLNFQAQPTGRYVARPPPADAAAPLRWIELDPLGNPTRELGCVGNRQPRFHDLLVKPDGSYWIMCDETRAMDLSSLGGRADALVTGTVIQHLSAAGVVQFQWSPFEHFAITDLAPEARTGPLVNWTHGNALDLDSDGHLLVSFRSLNEVTRIDTQSGQVLWRMGGLRNQFTMEGGGAPAFVGQHGVRAVGLGQLILLDNLGDAAGSRAERLTYDAQAMTVRQVASHGSLPPVIGPLGGTVQDLPGGRMLVSFGNGGRVEEYDAAGAVTWRLESPGYVFRAQRIQSLYQPGVGTPR